jgi:hypothetical protein
MLSLLLYSIDNLQSIQQWSNWLSRFQFEPVSFSQQHQQTQTSLDFTKRTYVSNLFVAREELKPSSFNLYFSSHFWQVLPYLQSPPATPDKNTPNKIRLELYVSNLLQLVCIPFIHWICVEIFLLRYNNVGFKHQFLVEDQNYMIIYHYITCSMIATNLLRRNESEHEWEHNSITYISNGMGSERVVIRKWHFIYYLW